MVQIKSVDLDLDHRVILTLLLIFGATLLVILTLLLIFGATLLESS